jgi:hypothetical protein
MNGEKKLCGRFGTSKRMVAASRVSLFIHFRGSSHLAKHGEENWGKRNMRRERRIVTICQTIVNASLQDHIGAPMLRRYATTSLLLLSMAILRGVLPELQRSE